jgi:hypothetical protein
MEFGLVGEVQMVLGKALPTSRIFGFRFITKNRILKLWLKKNMH